MNGFRLPYNEHPALIRSRGHFPKSGYDVHHGLIASRSFPSAGRKVDKDPLVNELDAWDATGMTPLLNAILIGDKEKVQRLLEMAHITSALVA